MRILTSSHYIGRFTVPRQQRHSLERARFVNLGHVWSPALAVATYPPWRSFELAHFVNHIPLALNKPWLVTFESALPRMFPPHDGLRRHLRRQLQSRQCLAIIAMSAWALANFKRANADWAEGEAALQKTCVLHPAAELRTLIPRRITAGETIRLVFVGNNFVRKGGIVALRLARKALATGLPVEIHVVSTKMICSGSHTDHPDPKRYQEDLKGFALPNVIFYGAMDNRQVIELMRRCHLTLLPTLHDTYGFSVLEGFANGLPAITSNLCALPEFVFPEPRARANGFLLDMPRDFRNCWLHEQDANSPDYWDMLDEAFDSMSDQALACLHALASDPREFEPLSRNAMTAMEQRHNPEILARKLDAIYCQKTPSSLAQDAIA